MFFYLCKLIDLFTMVVKRKRETTVVSKPKAKEDSPPAVDNAQDVFRKLFEAQFEPLDLPAPTAKAAKPSNSDEDEEDDDSDDSGSEGDWDGMSDISDESNQVEVVEHTDARAAPADRMDKKAWKAFMVGSESPNVLVPILTKGFTER